MDWDKSCEQFLSVRHTPQFYETTPKFKPAILKALDHLDSVSSKDIKWLEQALTDEQRKWFVAFVLSVVPNFPQALFMPMMRAAVYERNPSANRDFVEPCINAFGYRKVNEALLTFIKSGSNFEKAGACNALYWARVPLEFRGTVLNFDIENATPESRDAYNEINDIRLQIQYLFLQEFITNTDLDVRRSIVASLNLDPDLYPDELKPLINQAIQIARSHSDEYIRHRIEVQIGEEKLLKPLPHRD